MRVIEMKSKIRKRCGKISAVITAILMFLLNPLQVYADVGGTYNVIRTYLYINSEATGYGEHSTNITGYYDDGINWTYAESVKTYTENGLSVPLTVYSWPDSWRSAVLAEDPPGSGILHPQTREHTYFGKLGDWGKGRSNTRYNTYFHIAYITTDPHWPLPPYYYHNKPGETQDPSQVGIHLDTDASFYGDGQYFQWNTIFAKSKTNVTRNYNETIGNAPDKGSVCTEWGNKVNLRAPGMKSFRITYNLNKGSGSTNPSIPVGTTQDYQYRFDGFYGSATATTGSQDSRTNVVRATTSGLNGSISSSAARTVNYNGVYGSLTLPAIPMNPTDSAWDPNGNLTLTANYHRDAISLRQPTRTGYIFNGWYTSNNAKYTTSIPAISRSASPQNAAPNGTGGNFTLTAGWTPITYTIKFNPQGGTVNPTSKVLKYDEAYTFPTPVRSGYKFLGWYR